MFVEAQSSCHKLAHPIITTPSYQTRTMSSNMATEAARRKRATKIAAVVSAYFTISISLVFTNKLLMSDRYVVQEATTHAVLALGRLPSTVRGHTQLVAHTARQPYATQQAKHGRSTVCDMVSMCCHCPHLLGSGQGGQECVARLVHWPVRGKPSSSSSSSKSVFSRSMCSPFSNHTHSFLRSSTTFPLAYSVCDCP